jgi:predicted proteasome-type protease
MIDLSLKDDKLVLATIEKLRAKGNINDLPAILDYLIAPSKPEIEKALYNFIFDIKDAKATKPIIAAIQNEKYLPIQKKLIEMCWQSSLKFANHIGLFVDLLIKGDFEIAFEALTVIENMEEALDPKSKEQEMSKLKDAISTVSEDRKGWLHEAFHIIEQAAE